MRVPAIVIVVHEQVHEGACQQQQVWQYPEHVRTVLREQKKPGNRKKAIKHPAASG